MRLILPFLNIVCAKENYIKEQQNKRQEENKVGLDRELTWVAIGLSLRTTLLGSAHPTLQKSQGRSFPSRRQSKRSSATVTVTVGRPLALSIFRAPTMPFRRLIEVEPPSPLRYVIGAAIMMIGVVLPVGYMMFRNKRVPSSSSYSKQTNKVLI
ncbi:uncharacterized protein Pyn_12319 [Prunus yedoensis var. nudiflora]|uniref:Transmembrane protein n=6 Tax=Prunus TaxID=3754 RepID=A0A314ZWQ1_PRUYE|nr:uncharacterized protein Pyn_12319 [Prunus yedoensis var. nudiflora]